MIDKKNNYCVIMSGGVGSRFWPYSRKNLPKQFLDFFGTGRSLLQQTFERFNKVIPTENILIVTNELYANLVQEQLPQLHPSQILLEPSRRNTAPCIAWASLHVKAMNPNANIVVAPSDHLILKEEEFLTAISKGLKFVAENDKLLTLGIKPNRPETGYGYIQADLASPSLRNRKLFRVDTFREKPDLATAEQYIKKNNFFWNAGIFIWNVTTIVNAFRVYQPKLARIFESLNDVYGTPAEQEAIDRHFPQCENISVDYAIMEKAEEIFVCPADFGWSDLGTWGSLLAQSHRDLYGNAIIGSNVSVFETHNTIIHTTQERKVVVQGLDGFIVAENNNTLLICKLSEEQRIKQFSENE